MAPRPISPAVDDEDPDMSPVANASNEQAGSDPKTSKSVSSGLAGSGSQTGAEQKRDTAGTR